MSSFSGLLNNAALMLVLCFVYDTFDIHSIPRKAVKDGVTGVLVGLFSIVVMLNPWSLQPGVFFDTRWVLLSLSGRFFGFRPTLIAVILAGSFRLYQGGGGYIVGTVVIVVTAFVGVIWRHWQDKHNKSTGWIDLYLFGVVVQLAMLSCMFLMPTNMIMPILKSVALPILIIYPPLTLAIGLVLKRQETRRNNEKELAENRKDLFRERGLLRGVINSIPDLIVFKDKNGVYLGCNKSFESFAGMEEKEVIGKTASDIFDRDTADSLMYKEKEVLATGESLHHEEWITGPDGNAVLLDIGKTPFKGMDGTLHGLVGISRDITAQKRAEEERKKLQNQLIQAQKMESVGLLAGGVAHDFNNMLGVILGHAEMAMDQLDRDLPLFADLEEIRKAAERSAGITRQLLAFARKQAIAPRVINLNETVENQITFLRRLIGENIDLVWLPAPDLWSVKVDPSQMDQILTNICINARGAITGIGRITVQTGNRFLDDEYCLTHPGSVAGEYVWIAVSDNGRGMDKVTLAHIFEPFFTTKGVGEGTGLGLSTVYGAVKQNHGFIEVVSEPEEGSTFTIYLPRYLDKSAGGQTFQDCAPESASGGQETILLVEDEETILKMTSTMLHRLGYTVLVAASPHEALRVASEHSGKIHLLLTDVVMPEMNGRDLANSMQETYPHLKCLFMSGYTSDIITNHGVLGEEIQFIQKPFSKNQLAHKVKTILEV